MVKISTLQSLRSKYYQQFSSDCNRGKLVEAVDYFISTPISSIPQAQENSRLGSYTMIQRYFDKLLHYGLIEEITGGKRNRIYKATEILEILEK